MEISKAGDNLERPVFTAAALAANLASDKCGEYVRGTRIVVFAFVCKRFVRYGNDGFDLWAVRMDCHGMAGGAARIF